MNKIKIIIIIIVFDLINVRLMKNNKILKIVYLMQINKIKHLYQVNLMKNFHRNQVIKNPIFY